MLTFDLKKRFESFSYSLALSVGNEVLVLLAPSGGGKTLTLNMLTGLIPPDEGTIVLNGDILYDSAQGISIPIRERRIGYIFQDYALFPHRTVGENIAFGIRNRKQAEKSVAYYLSRFDLENKRDAYPAALSGGQQQRVAIARALAAESLALLFDEPLSALDLTLRQSLLEEIRETAAAWSVPVIYVTHNFREAAEIGDRIAVLDNGSLVECGEAGSVLTAPERLFTAQFTGIGNLFPCTVSSQTESGARLKIFNRFEIDFPGIVPEAPDNGLRLGIHDADVRLVVTGDRRPNELNAAIESISLLKRTYTVTLQVVDDGQPVPGFTLKMSIDELTGKKYRLSTGGKCRVSLKPGRLFLCRE